MYAIYVLRDPRVDGHMSVRYVGQTATPSVRLDQHISKAGSKLTTHRDYWINSSIAADIRPRFQVIEITENYAERESAWIDYFELIGCNLTNHTRGGEGRVGAVVSAVTREKLRIANTGKTMSAEAREKMSVAKRAMSSETRAKLAGHVLGRPSPRRGMRCSQETCERMRQSALKRAPCSLETRLKLSAKRASPEAVQNMRAAQQLRRKLESEALVIC